MGHSQDLLVNKLKYSESSDILCLTELLAIKGSILLLFSYLFCLLPGVLCQYLCKSFSMIPKLDKWKQMAYHGTICFILAGCIIR